MSERFISIYKNPYLYTNDKLSKTRWCYLCSLIRNSCTTLSNDQLPKLYFNYDKLNDDISHMFIIWCITINPRTKYNTQKMVGFLLANEEKSTNQSTHDNIITIDSLCCYYMKHSGTLLLNAFINFAKKNYTQIKLYSLLSSLNFYRRFNFIHSFDKNIESTEITQAYKHISNINYQNEAISYIVLKYEKALYFNHNKLMYNDTIKKYFDIDYIPQQSIFYFLNLNEKYFNKESKINGHHGLYSLISLLIKHKFTKENYTDRLLFMNDYDYTADGFYMTLYL